MAMNTLTPAAAQTPSSNADAVCTMSAPTDGSRWVLSSVGFGYSATPTGGQLIIAWGSVSETYYIAAAGPVVMSWSQAKRFPANTAVTITLKAGGSGIYGSVYPVGMTGM